MSMHFAALLSFCESYNLKITPAREWVLKHLHNATEPLSAYELLAAYRTAHNAGDAMTIYRALAYLETKHLIHKLHSQNKYTLCDLQHTHAGGQFFWCKRCHSTQEIHSDILHAEINQLAETNAFTIEESVLELVGVCQKCRDERVNLAPN